MITYDCIKISGALGLQKILDIKICILPNQHASAIIEGTYNNIDELLRWQKCETEQGIEICIKGEEAPIFCGCLKEIECECEADYYRVRLMAVSWSILLDREKISTSYQNTMMTYEEVVSSAINSQKEAYCDCTIGGDTKIDKPLIQYVETDWEFAKRLASHFQTVVYPMVNRPCPALWFGKPEGKSAELEVYEYCHGISNQYYELGGKQSGKQPRDFEYYIVKTSENLDVGAKVTYKEEIWDVWEKRAEMKNSELIFSYTLGRKYFVTQNKKYNSVFAGMSILGKVIETGGETVKLHLDIDKKQPKETAYPYVWAPDTSSAMYCMPKVGTTVSLYFADEDETSAKAVNCIRENGSTCEAMSNPQNRMLNTEHGKQLFLKEDSIGFDVEQKGHAFHMQDENGVDVSSKKMVRMVAGEEIKLKAKRISLETQEEMCIVRNPEGVGV